MSRKKYKFNNCELLKYEEFIGVVHYVICVKHVETTPCGLKHYICLSNNQLTTICELWIEKVW